MKHNIIRWASIIALFFCGWMVVSDSMVDWFHLIRAWQYAYNAVYFFILCPIFIIGADWVNIKPLKR